MSEMSVVIFVFCIISASSQTTNHNIYCDEEFSCGEQKHTMCEYGKPRSSFICRQIQDYWFSDSDIRWILGAHNGMRNMIANGTVPYAPAVWPQAANMRQITWDEDLALCARYWARQCRGGKDLCRTTTRFDYKEVQQNHYGPHHEWYYYPTFRDAITGWFNQMLRAHKSYVKSYLPTDGTEQFFLMMKAEVHKIGCGLVEYSVPSRKCRIYISGRCTEYHRYYGIKLACNYAPTKMKTGEPVWEIGPPCSKCPDVTDKYGNYKRTLYCPRRSTYKYLCADIDDPIDETPILLPLGAPLRSQVGFTLLLALQLIVHACN